MKTVLTIDCGSRARACAQGLAAAIFNADESSYLDVSVGARYEGSEVNIVIDDKDAENGNFKKIIEGISRGMQLVINAAKNGFDGNSPEEMIEIFSYPDEGTAFYSNVKGKTDLTVSDLEFLQAKLRDALVQKKMSISEAKEILEMAGLSVKLSKKKAVEATEEFYNDLCAAMAKLKYKNEPIYDSYEDFIKEVQDMGFAVLFNVATDADYDNWGDSDIEYSDHYLGIAEECIEQMKSLLSRKWTGFELDCDRDEARIFVDVAIDEIRDEN